MTLEGRPLVETKGLEFALSAGDVLRGRVVPREVELLGVSATVRRRTDGTIGLVAAANAETEGGPQEIDLDGLLAAGAAGGGDGFAGFGVRGAALTVVDDIMGMEWSVPRLDLAFHGDGGGTVAEGTASLRLGEVETDIGFTLSPSGDAGGPSLSARLHGLRPQDIAGLHPLLALLGYLTTPLSGSVAVHLAPDYAVSALEADLRGAGGAVADPQDTGRGVPVDGLIIQARAIDGLTRLEIETVEIKALGQTARLSGGGARQDGAVSAFTHLENLPPALLAPLLPPRLVAAAALDAPVSGTVAWTLDPDFRPLNLGPGADAWCRQPASRRSAIGTRCPGERQRPLSGRSGGGADTGRSPEPGAGPRQHRGQRQRQTRRNRMERASGRRGRGGSGGRSPVPVAPGCRSPGPPPVGAFEFEQGHGGQGPDRRRCRNRHREADLVFRSPAIAGSVSFSGVTARYWHPLPPFEDIGGKAVFDSQSFRLTLSGGKYRDIAVAGATVDFLGLDRETPPSRLAADVRFEGPLSDILEVLDREPLGYARYLGMDPAVPGGDAAFRLRVGLPLLASLALDDVALEAEGDVVNAHLPVAALKTNLEDARIDVKADKKHFAVSGGSLLGGQPATFDFEQRFSGKDPVKAIYRAALDVR